MWGGVHPGWRGRQTETKALVVVAVEVERGRLGRIRLRRLLDASGPSLTAFVQDAVAPDSLVHTDGWPGYDSLEHHGYQHQVTVLRGHAQPPAQLMPHVHQVVSLLKRWPAGHPSRRGHARTSGLLPRRVHLPVQPTPLAQPRQAVLSPRSASRRHRSGPLRVVGQIRQNAVIWRPQHVGVT